jgi:hypothetical protein
MRQKPRDSGSSGGNEIDKTETALPRDSGLKTLTRRISLLTLKRVVIYLFGITIALGNDRSDRSKLKQENF